MQGSFNMPKNKKEKNTTNKHCKKSKNSIK